MTSIRLPTPSRSIVKLGGFSEVKECHHYCDEAFYTREEALYFAEGVNFNWRNMRRSLAAIEYEECGDMANNPMAFMGAWWEAHKQDRREEKSGRLRITHRRNSDWVGWFTDDQLMGRMVPPGKWTLLIEDVPMVEGHSDPLESGSQASVPKTWMSDTPVEIADQMEFFDVAHGRVLVNGLGLGIMQEWILKEKPCVEHMDIVEIHPDVIDLIAPYFEPYKDRVTIHQGDAYTIKLQGEWDVVFHDIWPKISATNLPGMTKLMKRYAGRARWQGCWARMTCEELKKYRG